MRLSIQLLLPSFSPSPCFSITVHNPFKETELENPSETPPFLLSRAYPTHIVQGLWEDLHLQLWWAVVLLKLTVMMDRFRPPTREFPLRVALVFTSSLRCSGALHQGKITHDSQPAVYANLPKTRRLKRRDAEQ